ncbi:hypothetical protein [Streptococcus mutans]|nr:hypothetical protein [Streptococcus mutans]
MYLRHFTLEKAKTTGVINGGIVGAAYLLTCAAAGGMIGYGAATLD